MHSRRTPRHRLWVLRCSPLLLGSAVVPVAFTEAGSGSGVAAAESDDTDPLTVRAYAAPAGTFAPGDSAATIESRATRTGVVPAGDQLVVEFTPGGLLAERIECDRRVQAGTDRSRFVTGGPVSGR